MRVLDNDAAGVVLLPGSGATPPAVGESAASTTYTIRINRPGIGPVTIALNPLGANGLRTNVGSVTFTGATTTATITVSAVDDALREGFQYESHRPSPDDQRRVRRHRCAAALGEADEIFGSFGSCSLRGYIVRLVSGAGAGQWRYIRSNDAGKLFLQDGWDVNPLAGDQFVIQGYTAPASQSELAGTVASINGLTLTLANALPQLAGLGGLSGASIRIIDGDGPGRDAIRTIIV